jgi:hypothetical protein
MADPLYPKKLSRLFSEFVETGEADRLGYANAAELKAGFPEFFYSQVYPFITEGLRYLRKTQEGQQWIANLFHHVHELEAEGSQESGEVRSSHPKPHIAINNNR